MSGSASAWFPFYVGDYLGDTQRLTTEQHGAYLLLMLDYWRAGPPPDDDEVLRQIAKQDAKVWKRTRSALARMFQVIDGEWHHKRIDAELKVAEENAERRSSKAKAAAEARWGHSSNNAPSNARGIPQVMPKQCPDSAMLGECPPPSPSPKKKNSTDKSVEAAKRANRLPADFAVPPEWRAWAAAELGLSSSTIETEAAKFVDYWHAKTGRDASKLDWQATWRVWCRNIRQPSFAQSRAEWTSPC